MNKLIYKVSLLFAALFLTSLFASAQMQFKEIANENDWKAAVKEAKDSEKLIFLDIYATWCGPCKYLESTIYPDVTLGNYYNSHFINLKMDGETEFGRLKARQYALQAYPTMYYLTPSEDILTKVVGVKQAPELTSFGEKVVVGSGKLVKFNNDFINNKLTASELMAYRELLLEFEQEDQANIVSSKIIPSLSDDDILNPEYKSIVIAAKSDLDGKIFIVLKNKIDSISLVWSEEEMGQVFGNIFDASLNVAISNQNPAYKERIVTELLPLFQRTPESLSNAVYFTNKLYFANTGDWESFEDLVMALYNENFSGDDTFLYQEAFDIVNNYTGSPEASAFALKIMDSAVKINPSFDNLIMISYLNGANGNIDLAHEYLQKVEALPLTDQQKNILKELQNIIEQAG